MIDISSLIQRTIDVSTQIAKMTTSYDDATAGSVDRIVAVVVPEAGGNSNNMKKEVVVGLAAGKSGRATSTQSVGAEFYFKDVLFTQETPEFIL